MPVVEAVDDEEGAALQVDGAGGELRRRRRGSGNGHTLLWNTNRPMLEAPKGLVLPMQIPHQTFDIAQEGGPVLNLTLRLRQDTRSRHPGPITFRPATEVADRL